MKEHEAHKQKEEPEEIVTQEAETPTEELVDNNATDDAVLADDSEGDEKEDSPKESPVKSEAEPEESKVEELADSEETHASIQELEKKKSNERKKPPKSERKSKVGWPKVAGLATGVVAVMLLLFSAFISQYYKGKALPGVVVANTGVNAQKSEQVRAQLEPKASTLKITLHSGETKLQPALDEIGVQLDIDATTANVLQAKRHEGLLTKLAFWKQQEVPVVTKVDTVKLTQYIETNLPALSKPPTDSQLTFNANTGQFAITDQADGEGVAIETLQKKITDDIQKLASPNADVTVEKRAPAITQKALTPLIEPANEIVKRAIVLSGVGYVFQAQPSDIAAWITPTPKEDGSVKLVVDQSKIQAYVETVGKRISQPPQDRKVLTTTSGEVVLQVGQDGTELADREQLAKAISLAVAEGRDLSQQMNIQVAAFKTVNMEAYDRWVEVDLSEQRTTLYNGATPLQSFVISSGLPQWPTVTGEFKVWHKNATQTMTGGSRATGDFYSLPNVTWVTYFYKDYGFHTAYWHNNFGQPMSHGCVNMREAEAKIVYDFAPIGTTVIVHQ